MLRSLLRSLHLLLLGVCSVSLAFGWFEGLYFFFSMPGPSPGNMRSDLRPGGWTDFFAMPFLFLVGMPVVLFAPCCLCCFGDPRVAAAEVADDADDCCRCRCCSASFGRLPRAFGRRSGAWLAAALPSLLLACAIPWPAKAPKALIVHLAFAAMAVWLRRMGEAAGGGAGFVDAAPVVSQSVLLLSCIRAAAWSPNILFWSLPHAALCAIPALLLQAGLHVWPASENGSSSPTSADQPHIQVLPVSLETTELQQNAPAAAEGGGGGVADAKDGDGSVVVVTITGAPSTGAVAAAAIFLTTLAHFVIYFAPSPSLLVRGSEEDAAPELSTLLPPLLLWFASECTAVVVTHGGSGGGSTLTSIVTDSNNSRATRARVMTFVLLNLVGMSFFLIRAGTPSLCCGALLLALLPWWIRIAASKMKWWAAAGTAAWARLSLTMAWFALANVLALGLMWQSFILLRGFTGMLLLGVIFAADLAEYRLLLSTPRPTSTQEGTAVTVDTQGAPRLAAFVLLGCITVAALVVNAPVAPPAPTKTLSGTQDSFSVWSWNVQRGFSLTGKLNLDEVADIAPQADLLALQESEAHNPLCGTRDYAGYIGASTQQHAVVYGVDPLLADFDGTSILSKFPVLHKFSSPLYHYFIFPVFTATEVRVLLAPPASILTLINIHPTLTPTDMQEAAVALMLERVQLALSLGNHNNASAPAAVVVTGDFNIGPEDPMLDALYHLGFKHIFHPTRNETNCQNPLQDGGLGRCKGAAYDTTRPMSSSTLTPDHSEYLAPTL